MRVGAVMGVTSPLNAGLASALSGVDRILLAGGIGGERALSELATIAPVTAVVGQRDYLAFGDRFPESELVEIGGARVLLTELVGCVPDLLPPVRAMLEHDAPDVVVHGHEPRAEVTWIGGTLFVCPGRASGARPGAPATCAVLEIDGPGRITAHVLSLP